MDMKCVVYDSKDREWTIYATKIKGMRSGLYPTPDDDDSYEITEVFVRIAGRELEVDEETARKYIDVDDLEFIE